MNKEAQVQEDAVEVREIGETPAQQPQEGQQQIQLSDLKIGYLVGLTEDNNFVFDVFGKNQGLVELMGIHNHAERQIGAAYNNAQLMGDRLVHEIGKAIQVMGQKLDQVIAVVAPPKADNEIG